MKNPIFIKTVSLAVAIFSFFSLSAADFSTNFGPEKLGDHFSLEGALELFKQSSSPEDFEKRLNSETSGVNNLDLNGDGYTDYIHVIDHVEENAHAMVLQIAVNKKEAQDIAVIEIEQQGPKNAVLQIIGHEDIFGEQTIVEPFEEEATGGGNGGPQMEDAFRVVVVNVWAWPSVRFIFRPGYRAWVSPFRWMSYPRWWTPWRPLPLRTFTPGLVVYRPHYRVVTTHRVVRAHRVYAPVVRRSTVVRSRTTVVAGTSRRGTTVVKRTAPATRTVPKKAAPVARNKRTTTTVKKRKNGTTVIRRKG